MPFGTLTAKFRFAEVEGLRVRPKAGGSVRFWNRVSTTARACPTSATSPAGPTNTYTSREPCVTGSGLKTPTVRLIVPGEEVEVHERKKINGLCALSSWSSTWAAVGAEKLRPCSP